VVFPETGFAARLEAVDIKAMAHPKATETPYGLTREEWIAIFAERGLPRFRADQVLDWLYNKKASSYAEMSNLPKAFRMELEELLPLRPMEIVRESGSRDTTRKFLFRLHDAQLIETVLIPASPALYGERSDRRTLCVSSQVGCAYGCKFCASGLVGWIRHLSAGEIVEQIVAVSRLTGERIDNLVFMGMGEPLANYAALVRAIGILNASWGPHIGARRMTVSTSGLVPQIRQLADTSLGIRLAISLHGATDEVRERIMPVNRKYPLSELLEACAHWRQKRNQRITFEYILIENVNDSLEQAELLARHVKRLGARVNLIPYNHVEGLEWVRPSVRRQDAFLAVLTSRGASATIRREKGHDISAACGQLRLQTEKQKVFAAEGTRG